jgi:hypothetical protein
MAITDWLKTIDTWVTGLLSFLYSDAKTDAIQLQHRIVK